MRSRILTLLASLPIVLGSLAAPGIAHEEFDDGWTHDSWRGITGGDVGVVRASSTDDLGSANVRELTRRRIAVGPDVDGEGSDLAFQGSLMLAGSYQGTAIYRILRRRPYIRQIGFHDCPGSQGDVSVWGRYAFVSIDSPGSNSAERPGCNDTDDSAGQEGIRIIDISDPTRPRQVKFVATDCGSHTHTLVPAGKRLYVYVLSYPLGAPTPTCNPESHRKISVIRFRGAAPAKARVVSTPDVSPSIGCHDVTVATFRKLAFAACISESQIWDISDPAHPEIRAHVVNEQVQIHHSSAITWDGTHAILGDEQAGAAAGQCPGDDDTNQGAMWFYDIRKPAEPVLVGHHALPRPAPVDSADEAERVRCSTHNFNIVPTRNARRYVAVSAYYAGGISVVDFSDPANAREIGWYISLPGGTVPDTWSAYWYNGRIYTNDHSSKHGVRVLAMRGTGRSFANYFRGRLNPQTQVRRFT